MRRVRPVSLLAAAACIVSLLAARPAHAQEPNPAFDARFTQARALEANQPLRAIEAYSKVKNSAHNREIEADALLRASLLGYNALVNPPADVTKLTGQARTERDDVQLQAARQGHDAVKQLADQYADTKAGEYARDAHWGPDGSQNLREALEAQIDIRNAHNPSYQAVNFLVRLTGGNPAYSYWLALVMIALIVKSLTLPLSLSMYRSQREMKALQPMMEELKKKYKPGSVEYNEKQMALFKEHNVNPFASCLPMLIQLPFMYWVYDVIRLYEFHFANGKFLWIGSAMSHQYRDILATNLAQFDVPLLCIYSASNYLSMYLTPSTDQQQAQQQRTMAVMTSVMMFIMFMRFKWSAAFIFYWLILNLLNTAQLYWFVYRPNKLVGGTNKEPGNSVITLRATDPVADGDARAKSNGSSGAQSRTIATPIPNSEMRSRPKRKKR